ncbi:hypothetical protein F2Q69_00007037 [Brassica cretica]|uniref:Uncharacterized protein n=1 Tax=Brassica cretica TaxID=69181 RepID=A0A8S9P9N1_BRACR|nr:hypothetical protein F2Q69_00007037 [Brassica cretica]
MLIHRSTRHVHHRSTDVTNVDVALMTSMEPESSDGNRRTNIVSTEMKHATSFTPTKLAPEIYTKDEINEMVTGICGAQEKLGDELKPLVDDTYQPLDIGYNELFRSMAEMRTKIESMQHILEKEATTSPSIDANKAASIDVKPQTSQIPAEPESLAEKKDEWEIAYINTQINDVYNPLNNNVDWLSTRIDQLQQDLDTIRKKDQQPSTSIDICTITSIDSKFAAMEDRLQTYEDMHDRFTSPIMRYLDTLSTQMMNVQRDIGTLNDQHDFQEECSTSIDRDPNGHARAMDGRILQVSREDIADILQLANGPDNLFMQQHNIPDNIPAVPDEHPRADTTEIGSHQSAPSPSIDRRYECGRRAYDIYEARKFRWEHNDEYGVYRDESGYARSVAGEMIPVTKDNIRKILERASLFEESHICLPEHATSFTPTKLAPEIYTKDEINEMVTVFVELKKN